jgi:hypothetical protein
MSHLTNISQHNFLDASAAKAELARREEELAQLKKQHDIGED